MTDLATLRDLEARLAAATGPDRELDALIESALFGGEIVWKTANWTMEPYPAIRRQSKHHIGGFANEHVPTVTASIDAAVALCERVHPGADLRLRRGYLGDYSSCDIGKERGLMRGRECFAAVERPDNELALAICSAIVSALIVQEEAHGLQTSN